jgi:hypothetical protein
MTKDEIRELLLTHGPKSQVAKFMSRIEIADSGCWIWTGSKTKDGYGKLALYNPKPPSQLAHRMAYFWVFGTLPSLGLDHIVCDNEGCANPYHVTPATAKDNTLRGNNAAANNARKTCCKRGHPFTHEMFNGVRWTRFCYVCYQEKLAKSRIRKNPLPSRAWTIRPMKVNS